MTPLLPRSATTRLKADLDNLLWSAVNLFDRAGGHVQRDLDRNDDDQKWSQKEQDGAEMRSVELEPVYGSGHDLGRAPQHF